MKYCAKCKIEKPFDEFHFRKTRGCYHSWCKKCATTTSNQRYRERKKKVVELFGGCCSICGYKKNINALDFHHLDKKTKDGSWSSLKQSNWNTLLVELKKCILVCKNCHAEIHYPELSDNELKVDTLLADLQPTGKCKICENDVYKTTYCSRECSDLARRKVSRPSYLELKKQMSMPMTALGKKYGVSDNAVRKWYKFYGLT